MPEGHTLFALARDLDAAYRGTRPEVSSPQGKFAAGAARLSGRTFVHATSWGKHLFAEFDGDAWLHVHLGLIGKFVITERRYAGDVPVVGQVRLRLATDEYMADLRGANLCAVITPDVVEAVTSRLGPDPLRPEPDPDIAWRRIARSGKSIAELLMDQSVLAGVGNVYRCEVLFRQRVDPFRPGREIRRTTWDAIWLDLVHLLPLGVATGKIVTVAEQEKLQFHTSFIVKAHVFRLLQNTQQRGTRIADERIARSVRLAPPDYRTESLRVAPEFGRAVRK